ncbi:MAG TPA: ABC transporter permease subunit, partial [Rhodopila sp.]|nr:ABC transporter permease subunit [Rhodopila sp.]
LLAIFRAIPDLTLAIFCVVLFGLGPGAGMLALALFYTGAVAKVFGDLLRTVPRQPVQALQATGAGRIAIALFGLLPLASADLLTYGSYEFESAVRASVVVGAVGGGGLGSELVGTLASLDYQRTATIILILVLIVAAIDRLTVALRRRPRLLWLLLPVGLMSVWQYGPHLFAFSHAAHTFGAMLPPKLTTEDWARIPHLLAETLAMAAAGTALAVVPALPLGLASARNIAPAWFAVPVRRFLEALRAVPEVVWGLVLIAIAGVGPTAGALALALHSTGSLGRLYAESFENVPRAPVLALAGTGAGRVAIAGFATLPLALAPIAVHSLFRLEWNLRMAAVVGMIGAGGIGQALYDAQQMMFYPIMMGYLLVTMALVAGADALSLRSRRAFGWTDLPRQ